MARKKACPLGQSVGSRVPSDPRQALLITVRWRQLPAGSAGSQKGLVLSYVRIRRSASGNLYLEVLFVTSEHHLNLLLNEKSVSMDTLLTITPSAAHDR